MSIILAPEPDSILLIRRAERAGDPWSGHVALPGGRREPGDRDMLATAIRETREEVGVDLLEDYLVGRLDDVVPRTPVLPAAIAVRPFVFAIPARPGLKLNSEIASATWVGVEDLSRPGAYHTVQLGVGGEQRPVQAYVLEDAVVWGMTERILSGLIRELEFGARHR